ncbi:tubby-like protein 8 [Punica granatum]|uniref:Tubby-like protein 8 n=1 Tax=Punica granatum TaxID=22663 RepID=A0A6P8CY73_PUNGR|nr:tubby-like protein 8 [Punica granatum]
MLGDKENSAPAPTNGSSAALKKPSSPSKCLSSDKLKVLKPSSLQFCMQMNGPDSAFWSKFRDPIGSENSNSANIWDFSDSEAAPASSWSTLPNRWVLADSCSLVDLHWCNISRHFCKVPN